MRKLLILLVIIFASCSKRGTAVGPAFPVPADTTVDTLIITSPEEGSVYRWADTMHIRWIPAVDADIYTKLDGDTSYTEREVDWNVIFTGTLRICEVLVVARGESASVICTLKVRTPPPPGM